MDSRADQSDFINLFERSPLSLWEEDMSAVKSYLDDVKNSGVEDIRRWFEAHPEAIVQCSELAQVVRTNASTLRLFEANTQEELIGSLGEIFTPVSYGVFADEITAFHKGETQFSAESEQLSVKGRKLWVKIWVDIAPGYEETWEKVHVTIADLTDRKLAEENLVASEKRIQDIVNTSADWFWEIDQHGVYTYTSPGVSQHLGYSPEELLGRQSYEFMEEEEKQRVENTFKEIFSTQAPYRDLEVVSRHKNGSRVVMSTSGVPVFSENGELVGYRGADRDISDQVRYERSQQELNESLEARVEERTRTLVEREKLLEDTQRRAMLGSWIHDVVKDELSWTNEVYRIFGMEPGELEPSLAGFMAHVHPDDFDYVNEQYGGAVEGKFPYDIEHRIIRTDNGEVRWVHELCAHTRDENGVIVRSEGSVQEITDRKLAEAALIAAKEAAETANLAKSSFLANMSHEVRTPMNGVVGMAEVLAQTELNGDQRRMVQTITSSSMVLLGIIDDILDLSKIDAGKLEFEHTEMSLRDVVENVMVMSTPEADEQNVRLHLIIDPHVPVLVNSDPVRLRQIINNLVSNAVKFSRKQTGEKKGQVYLIVESADKNSIRIRVRDDGIGMSEEMIGSLYKPFVQAETSTTRRFGGSGLGLSIVYNLVRLMGGAISVESELNEGTAFVVTLPVERVEAPEVTDLENLTANFDCFALLDDEANPRVVRAYLDDSSVIVIADTHRLIESLRTSTRPALVLLALDSMVETSRVMALVREQGLDASFLCQTSNRMDQLGLIDSHCYVVSRFPTLFSEIERGVSVLLENLQPEISRVDSVKEQSREAETAGRKIRVLLVEDNEINQEVISAQLDLLGYQVKVARNGAEGVEYWEAGDFDLILADCHMPVLDGFEMTDRIRQSESQKGIDRTPIIAITANALKGEDERCLAAGMDDYLSKPVDMNRMEEVLAQWSGR